jgi:hypothetical protein
MAVEHALVIDHNDQVETTESEKRSPKKGLKTCTPSSFWRHAIQMLTRIHSHVSMKYEHAHTLPL